MISVIIPSFNRRDCLTRLIRDLYLQEDAEFEVIVVDDGSSDGSVEAVRATDSRVKLIINDVNSGCSVTRNRGIREARGQIIVGLDSDVSLPDNKLLSKVEKAFADSPETTGLAFRVFDSDGHSDDVPRWCHPKPIAEYADRAFETDYFSGTAFAFRREALMDAGMFPEHIFQYYEEVELSYRIIDQGGTLQYQPQLSVVHHPGARFGWSDHRFRHTPRSQIALAYSCYRTPGALFFLATRLGFSLLRAIKARRLGVYLKGIREGIGMITSGRVKRMPLKASSWKRIRAIKSGTSTH